MQLQESLSPCGFLDCILGHQDRTDHVACMDGFPSHTVHIADIYIARFTEIFMCVCTVRICKMNSKSAVSVSNAQISVLAMVQISHQVDRLGHLVLGAG